MNVFEKFVEVRKVAEGFTKDTKGYGYKYVSGDQILSKIKDKMNELKLVLVPIIKESTCNPFEHEGKNGQIVDFIVSGQMEYHWVNAEDPDDKIVVPWAMYGMQTDPSKGFGSALTYAERYFYLKSFGVPTDGDDPDAKDTQEPLKRPTNEKFIQECLKLGYKFNKLNDIAGLHGFASITQVHDRKLQAEIYNTLKAQKEEEIL